jgi:hypothetical protein
MEKLKEGAVYEDLPAGFPMLPSLATNAQRTLVQALLADGQTHLFDNWHLGENEESKLMFLNQVFLLLEHGTWVIQSKVAVLRWNNGKI